MVNVRSNVWNLGGDWAAPILWYARGVAALKAKPLADPASWRSYGAIHGLDEQLWELYGYLTPTEARPPAADVARYWDQCQHGSWYFLPWHRGYLLAIESNIRAAIAGMPGAPSDWALPYWNYFKPGQNKLPPAFASPDWPDGTGDNPLYVEQRWGPNNDGNVFIPLNQVNLQAMAMPKYTGVASGGSPGFGGPSTGFSHGGRTHGGLESQPHDMVHVFTGGEDPSGNGNPGLMSYPPTARLDPIFYLHHANIDRLWQAWNVNAPPHTNPPDANWVDGPVKVGQRKFSMPMANGTGWDYTPDDMVDIAKLGYAYDDLAPAGTVALAAVRPLVATGAPQAGDKMMAAGDKIELVGANDGEVPLVGAGARTIVRLDPQVRAKVAAARPMVEAVADSPAHSAERVLLNLENVRGLSDATAFQVYVNLPEGSPPSSHPELLAGSVGLFGVRQASDPDGEHGGQGLNFVLDITPIVDALHLQNSLDADALHIELVSARPVSEAANIHIGRISIVRQGD